MHSLKFIKIAIRSVATRNVSKNIRFKHSDAKKSIPAFLVHTEVPGQSEVKTQTLTTPMDIDPSKVELPPINKWLNIFPTRSKLQRAAIRNPALAKQMAEKMVPEGSKDMVIIESSPGPGQLTRALMALPKSRIKKLILLENVEQYVPYLKPLELVDPRVSVVLLDGKDWSTYNALEKLGLLDDLEVVDWNQVHPNLAFIMQVSSSVYGEQLISQLLRAIPDRSWLFKYGRIPMHLLMTARMWERIRAAEDTLARCKVSVMAQCVAELAELLPYEDTQPFNDHFHPASRVPVYGAKVKKHYKILDERKPTSPHVAVSMTPLQSQMIAPGDLEYWDYSLRKLFVQRATSFEKAVSTLAPGGRNLIPKIVEISPEFNVTKPIRNLTNLDWLVIIRAFKEWPFRPTNLSIDTFVTGNPFVAI